MTGLRRTLDYLTHRGKVLAVPQAQEMVSASTIRRAVRDGLLVSIPTLVYWPPLSLPKPLALWKPGDPHEDAAIAAAAHIEDELGLTIEQALRVMEIVEAAAEAALEMQRRELLKPKDN